MAIEDRLTAPRQLSFGFKQMDLSEYADYFPKVEHDETEASRALEEFFSKSSVISTPRETIIKAYEELLINNNTRYALLDTFIAAESFVSNYLFKLKLSKGASKNKLDDYKDEIPISYMLNIELPVLLGNLTSDERQIIGNVDRVRKLRNCVVHEGKEVTKDDTIFAINAVNQFIDMLEKRSIT